MRLLSKDGFGPIGRKASQSQHILNIDLRCAEVISSLERFSALGRRKVNPITNRKLADGFATEKEKFPSRLLLEVTGVCASQDRMRLVKTNSVFDGDNDGY
jgi:hypothetical protein